MTSILESLIGAVLALLTLTMHDESGFSFGMAAIYQDIESKFVPGNGLGATEHRLERAA